MDKLARGETGFTRELLLSVYGIVRPHSTGEKGPAIWLTLAYLRDDKQRLDAAWHALSPEEQGMVCRRLLDEVGDHAS